VGGLASKNALSRMEGDYYYTDYGYTGWLQPNMDDDVTIQHYNFGPQDVHLHGIGVGAEGGIAKGAYQHPQVPHALYSPRTPPLSAFHSPIAPEIQITKKISIQNGASDFDDDDLLESNDVSAG
jgi:hypothetical protein